MTEAKPNVLVEGAASSSQRAELHGRPVANEILLGIPDHEYGTVRPHLEFVTLLTQQVLQEPGEAIEHVVFLNSGLVSLLVVTSDAHSVEVGMAGRDGCVGGAVVSGVRQSSQRALVQIPRDAFRIKAEILVSVIGQCPRLREDLNRYVLLQGMQAAQLAACNRLHEVDERLARWLLMSHDRATGDSVPVTHDQLAQMLGSGRPSVTVAAGTLARRGVIEYKRGQMKVVNRKALEQAGCECYDAMRRIRAFGSKSLTF